MKSTFAKLVHELKQFKAHFFFALTCMFFSGLANVLPSWFIKVSIDGVSAMEEGARRFRLLPTQLQDFEWLPQPTLATSNLHYILPVLIVVVFAVSAFLRFLYEYNVRNVGLLVVRNMREKFHAHMQRLSLATQMKYDSGSLVSRVTGDLSALQSWVSECLTNIFNEGFKAFFLFCWLLVLDVKLTVLTLIVIPLFAFPVFTLGTKIRSYSKKGQEFIGGLTTFLGESIQNQRVVKAYNMEQRRQKEFIKESNDLYGAHRKWVLFMAMVSPLTNVIAAVGIATMLFLGLSSVTDGYITIGEFSSFFVTSILLYDPVKRIGRITTTLQSVLGVAERVFVVMDEEVQNDSGLSKVTDKLEGHIEFKNIDYSYLSSAPGPDGGPFVGGKRKRVQIFDKLSLDIKAKSSIALVGPSGSGKTTLVSLIPRFFEVDGGEILIDKINVQDLSLSDLRNQIALVTQDSLLFTGTIRDNLLIGKASATEEELIAACKKAHVYEFLQELDDGLDSHIGERGQLLSVGQRQRVSLARAFLSDAPIVILDEPTSALDNESESLIYDAINELMKDHTVLVIAHRLNTIKNCDRIVYLQDGQILESGSHEDLITQNGLYSKLLQEV